MAKLLKLRRGTTTQHSSFTGAEGEVTIDTTKDTAVVHDGSTQGGRALLREDASNLPDQSIQLNHLPHGTSSNNGKFLRANNGADPTFEVVNTDLVADTSPQLGGNLASNGRSINMANTNAITLGGGVFSLTGYSGNNIYFEGDSTGSTVRIRAKLNEEGIRLSPNQQVELYYDNAKKVETTATGATVTGTVLKVNDNGAVNMVVGSSNASGAYLVLDGDSNGDASGGDYTYFEHSSAGDLNIVQNNPAGNGKIDFHTGGQGRISLQSDKFRPSSNNAMTLGTSGLRWSDLYIANDIYVSDNGLIKLGDGPDLLMQHTSGHNFIEGASGFSGNLYIRAKLNENGIILKSDNAVDLYYDNARKLSTKSTGVEIPGNCAIELDSGNWTGNHPGKIQHHNNYLYIQGGTNGFIFMDDTGTGTAIIDSGGTLRPGINNTYDLGSSSYRWANIHTNDLHLSNEGSSNDVDGTWGDWTMQEGESDLFLKNNRSGKKYKFNLTEVS